ncbi:rab-GTPase-TBC domain-containing protein [Dipodascopsis uninucleata]
MILTEQDITEKDFDNYRESLVTVALSETSSDSSDSPETYSERNASVAHSSLNTSVGVSEPSDDDADHTALHKMETVDWEGLERTECEESRDCTSEESTALLLARLERENARFEKDPKALSSISPVKRRRPCSVRKLRQIVQNQNTIRHSMIPEPPLLTDLEFWAAVVADYPRTAAKLPCLLSKKLKAGIPPPLRGLIWQSMANASDPALESLFNALVTESSPYDKVIGRDLHRTFPEVEMFREQGGSGQQMLAKVLRAFSLYDMQVGYCQGLAFLVGPLLMHMDECSAFCILVRLMEEYDLRTMFTADMSGLHLRIFQFSMLMKRFVPTVYYHLEKLGVQSVYASQWFLSFFAVTCPLTMLLRIYDIIFAEGALETLMRVSIALMQGNERRILALREEDEILQLLLSRSLWEVYDGNTDGLISDAMALTTIATRDVLGELEKEYNAQKQAVAEMPLATPAKPMTVQASELHTAAARFLGRIWSNVGHSGLSASPNVTGLRNLHHNSSRASFGSMSSYELDQEGPGSQNSYEYKRTRDLHCQIEDLVVALSTLQKQHMLVVEELEAEKRVREEERNIFESFLGSLPKTNDVELSERTLKMKERFHGHPTNRLLTFKDLVKQLEEAWTQLNGERQKNITLQKDLDEQNVEIRDLKDQLHNVKNQYHDAQKEKSKLERSLTDLRQRQQIAVHPVRDDTDSYYDPPAPTRAVSTPSSIVSGSMATNGTSGVGSGGLRELRLGRQNQLRTPTQAFSKRSSSLYIPEEVTLALNAYACESCEALKIELAGAKTSEAVAKQECEETKIKLDQLRKQIARSNSHNTNCLHGSQRPSVDSSNSEISSTDQMTTWSKIGRFAWGS